MNTVSLFGHAMPRWIALIVFTWMIALSQDLGATAPAEDTSVKELLATIARADDPDYDVESIRKAWARLIDCPVEAIPEILESIDSVRSLVTVNWLSAAFDRIVEKGDLGEATRSELKSIAEDAERSGYARQLALRQLERSTPGFQAAFIASRLGDAEFGTEAVAARIATADKKLAEGDESAAAEICKNAFMKTTDFEQAVEIAEKLKELGVRVPLVEHLGLLVEWHLVGPFPGREMTAFDVVYPPEQHVDLSCPVAFEGRSYPWQHVELKDSEWRFNLKELLADANDCVAFAYTEFAIPEAREVELRAGSDDTLAVWHNGEPVYSFPHFGNHLRPDRHRVPLRLTKGKNTLLLKVAEAVIVPGRVGGGPKKWEFAARLVGPDEHGVIVSTVKREE